MNKKMSDHLKAWVTKNGSYKIVALFVALVLWVTILGRKNIVLNHEVELQIHLATDQLLKNELPKNVKVRLSGPRMGLKSFVKSGELITLDLAHIPVGWHKVKIPKESLNLPLGVKLLSLKPAFVRVRLIRQKNKNKDENGT